MGHVGDKFLSRCLQLRKLGDHPIKGFGQRQRFPASGLRRTGGKIAPRHALRGQLHLRQRVRDLPCKEQGKPRRHPKSDGSRADCRPNQRGVGGADGLRGGLNDDCAQHAAVPHPRNSHGEHRSFRGIRLGGDLMAGQHGGQGVAQKIGIKGRQKLLIAQQLFVDVGAHAPRTVDDDAVGAELLIDVVGLPFDVALGRRGLADIQQHPVVF